MGLHPIHKPARKLCHEIAIVVADRRYRLVGLMAGEVALHDDQGQTIIIKRDHIRLTALKVVIDSADVQLGGDGGAKVARIGDKVQVSSGSSAGLWPIVDQSVMIDFYAKTDQTGRFYVDINNGNPNLDTSLRAAVIASLFTDRRLTDTDPRPQHLADDIADYQGGYWADDFPASGAPAFQAQPHGSLLWVLRRAKQTDETRALAIIYIGQSLQWLIDVDLAVTIKVDAWWHAPGLLACSIDATLPGGSIWQATYNAVNL